MVQTISRYLPFSGRTAIYALMATGLAGCSGAVPSCSDSAATDLVIEIAYDELAKVYGKEKAGELSLSVAAIRTTESNPQTGAHACAANLEMRHASKSGSANLSITYTVEMTDSGDEIYVNVYGL